MRGVAPMVVICSYGSPRRAPAVKRDREKTRPRGNSERAVFLNSAARGSRLDLYTLMNARAQGAGERRGEKYDSFMAKGSFEKSARVGGGCVERRKEKMRAGMFGMRVVKIQLEPQTDCGTFIFGRPCVSAINPRINAP